jgi:hypothetical protein
VQETKVRLDAVAQLKVAIQIIEQGKREIATANDKIEVAQRLIDASVQTLHDTLVQAGTQP